VKKKKLFIMKNNNYKQLLLTKSPSEPSVFKRSASHSLRSSFRLTKKINNVPTLSYSSLPSHIPPKAAALLEIPLPPINNDQNKQQKLKVATIRRKAVWANNSASKRLIVIVESFLVDEKKTMSFILFH
jgi:hypothetical protein